MYATCDPLADSIIPEDSAAPEDAVFALDDDLSEARATVDQMTASGSQSDKGCRKLVTDTRKEVTDNVDFCQKAVNELPRGDSCPSRGQEAVKLATEAKAKADKHVVYCKTQVTQAEQYEVDFGSRTYSSLTYGKCSSFYASTSYTTAKTTYVAAVTAHTKAVGAATSADKALKDAIIAAAKEKHECLCKVKADHESTFTKLSAADASNQKLWHEACLRECVLDKKTTCKCTAAPKCHRAKVTAEVTAAKCTVAKRIKEVKQVAPRRVPQKKNRL